MLLSKEVNEFFLNGYGYLERISEGKKCLVVRLKVLTSIKSEPADQSDEILLDCEVGNLALLSKLDPMYEARKKGHCIALRFACVYSGFGHYHPGLTHDDPAHMVMLCAKLISVGEWYCNSQRVYDVSCTNTARSSQNAA